MNTWPSEGDNGWKRSLIPRKPEGERPCKWPPMDGFASYQLVGGVRAYQGEDG